MDYTLIALIALIVLTVVVSTRYQRRSWARRAGYKYQRVITMGVFGLWFTIAGAIGWDVSHVHGLLQGAKWVGGPIWWQIGTGVALLGGAMFLGSRVPPDAPRTTRP